MRRLHRADGRDRADDHDGNGYERAPNLRSRRRRARRARRSTDGGSGAASRSRRTACSRRLMLAPRRCRARRAPRRGCAAPRRGSTRRCRGDPHDVGDLALVEIRDVAQHHREPLPLGELLHQLPHLTGRRAHVRAGRETREHALLDLPPPGAAAHEVDRDTVRPPLGRRHLPHPCPVAPRPRERLVGHVGRQVPVTGEGEHRSREPGMSGPVPMLERSARFGAHTLVNARAGRCVGSRALHGPHVRAAAG